MGSPVERIAVLADIHGNSWALDAVLEDLERREVSQIVNLGDTVYGPLDPAGTAERVRSSGMVSIQGNMERILFDASPAVRCSPGYRFVMAALSAGDLDWLQSQPATAVLSDLFCCHGTPSSDETYLLEEVTSHGVDLRSSEAIRALLAGISEPVIVCAHSHIPRTVQLANGPLVLNPGSVGAPAYDQDQPYPHVMEVGSPHARYAILEAKPSGWRVEQFAVPYNWGAAATAAETNGRADWAEWIRTGRAE